MLWDGRFPVLFPQSSHLFPLHDNMGESHPLPKPMTRYRKSVWRLESVCYRKNRMLYIFPQYISVFLCASDSAELPKCTRHNLLRSCLAEIMLWSYGSFNGVILPTSIKHIFEITKLLVDLRKLSTAKGRNIHKHEEIDEFLVSEWWFFWTWRFCHIFTAINSC